MSKQNRQPTKITQHQLRILGNRLLNRHRNFYVYAIFGFLAALINILTFMLLHNLWKIPLLIANTLAFIISNLASFSFNKHGVFVDNIDSKHSIWYQISLFFTFRILSYVPDNFIMWIGLSILHLNTFLVKIIDQIVVGIFNYISTKWIFIEKSKKFTKRFKIK